MAACFIHASILLQFRPAVKGITCDFFGISLVGLGRAQGIIAEVFDEHGVYCTDKDTGIGKPCSDRLIVPSGVLHTDFCFPVKSPYQIDQVIDSGLCVHKVLGGIGQTYCLTHSNSLSNKMDNSLLAVRGINHKYIVVGGMKNGMVF